MTREKKKKIARRKECIEEFNRSSDRKLLQSGIMKTVTIFADSEREKLAQKGQKEQHRPRNCDKR